MLQESTTKQCFKCRVSKPLDDFYQHPKMSDGHLNKCKECTKTDVSSNYRDKRIFYAEYDISRNMRPERKAYKAIQQKKYRFINADKYKARMLVGNALRSQLIFKKNCEVCGSSETQAHHEDYSKPLDVQWLCFSCHRREKHGQTVLRTSPCTLPNPQTAT